MSSPAMKKKYALLYIIYTRDQEEVIMNLTYPSIHPSQHPAHCCQQKPCCCSCQLYSRESFNGHGISFFRARGHVRQGYFPQTTHACIVQDPEGWRHEVETHELRGYPYSPAALQHTQPFLAILLQASSRILSIRHVLVHVETRQVDEGGVDEVVAYRLLESSSESFSREQARVYDIEDAMLKHSHIGHAEKSELQCASPVQCAIWAVDLLGNHITSARFRQHGGSYSRGSEERSATNTYHYDCIISLIIEGTTRAF